MKNHLKSLNERLQFKVIFSLTSLSTSRKRFNLVPLYATSAPGGYMRL